VNTADHGSGAERVAWSLFKGFQRRGLESWLVVGDKKSDDPHVMPFFLSPYIKYAKYAAPRFQRELNEAKRRDTAEGVEDFHFPYSKYLPSITGSVPDVVLCHNLHGGFFDLRVLAGLSQQLPVFLVLHDSWTMTGHCAQPVGCSRWGMGCGGCPDLSLSPAIQKDASDLNWRRKQSIYEQARLFVAAPTRWLLERARQSILAPAMLDGRVIPCPVDVERFRPGSRSEARHELGLPPDAHLLVFAAHQARTNPYKDFGTIEASLRHLARLMPDENVLFVGLGEAGPEQRMSNVRLQFLAFQPEETVIRYLQAADVYVHAATAENFGLVTAEAQGCGTPVVATAVGGLPEVVRDGERGLLVPPAGAEQMAQAVHRLLKDPALRHRLGEQAARHAHQHWAQRKIVNEYLSWFREMRDGRAAHGRTAAARALARSKAVAST
jgi:glycosyltransferase involved in cell wall biosynthesis